MSDLKAQILARIDETPLRPPTHRDIVQRLYPLSYAVVGELIKAMLAAGEIDTENGTDGLTYIKAKAPHVPVEIERTPEVCNHAGIAYFPSKNKQVEPPKVRKVEPKEKRIACATPKPSSISWSQTVSNARALRVQKKDLARLQRLNAMKPGAPHLRLSKRTQALIKEHLDRPMSAAQFHEKSGAKCKQKITSGTLHRAEKQGFIFGSIARPKVFSLVNLSEQELVADREKAQAVKNKKRYAQRGIDPEQMAAEYRSGMLLHEVCRKWKCHHDTAVRIISDSGQKIRTVVESQKMLVAENAALKARIAELESQVAQC